MSRYVLPFAALFALAACDGPAVVERSLDEDGGDTSPLASELPPGTTNPSANSGITRYEALDRANGNGFAQSFRYDEANDRFYVDNLAFDGANSPYTRVTALGAFDPGPFRVYEGPSTYADNVTGAPIEQFLHRAILGTSPSGEVEFAIVRTGSYVNYGFGGFIYSRDGSVTLPLPDSGQAHFEGDYRALRDFQNRGGIEYSSGDMYIDIDFEDFNEGDAVKGAVFNRRIYDVDGVDITASVIAGLQSEYDNLSISAIPNLVFEVGPGHVDSNGEMAGNVISTVVNGEGAAVPLESGKYYALLSGEGVDEIVGVIVAEAEDARSPGVTVRETGGFILTRP